MATLTAVDNEDGTGASLVVSGNSGTATIWASRFLGTNAGRTFLQIGTVSGNGELEADLDVGAYLGVLVDGLGVPALPITFRVTDGTLPLYRRVMEAIREYVLSLALPGVSMDPDDHVICKVPYRANLELDLSEKKEMGVFYFPQPESYRVSDNSFNEVKHMVQIVLARKSGNRIRAGLDDILMSRELLGKAIHGEALSDENCINTVMFRPGAVIVPPEWKNQYDVSTVVCECLTEQAGVVE